jgi:Flp pilus assembly protein TadG
MRRRAQLGATLVEAAVTALTLFTLVMGVAEFGRAYSIRQTLTNAAREGARYAVAPDAATGSLPGDSDVKAFAAPLLGSNSVKGTVTVITTTHTINGVAMTYTQVTASAPYSFFFFPFGTITMTATSEMRNETN